MEKTQREYYLNEQMKAIQKELGDGEDGLDELGEIEKKIEDTKLSKEAKEKAKTELKKLRQIAMKITPFRDNEHIISEAHPK
jgi:ATP-dependent Lon protease